MAAKEPPTSPSYSYQAQQYHKKGANEAPRQVQLLASHCGGTVPVCREVLEAGVLLASEVLHGSLEGGVVTCHDVLLSLQGTLPLLPLPPCAAYLGAPLAQGLLHHFSIVTNML